MTVIFDRDLEVPMRDGCVLRANVYRPAASGRYPALLLRTPYSKEAFQTTHTSLDPVRAAEAGYVVVVQDTRGRFASAGDVFDPYFNDFEDGYDTAEWAAALPYVNGKTGAYGVSYLGGTAWWTAAAGPPSLRAIAPTQAPNDLFVNLIWRGGAFMWGQHLFWSLQTIGLSQLKRIRGDHDDYHERLGRLVDQIDSYAQVASLLPPCTLNAGEPEDPFFPYIYDLMSNTTWGEFYQQRGTLKRHNQIAVPALIVAGWYDVLLGSDLDHYRSIRREGLTREAREGTRLLVGPWSHGVGLHSQAVGQLDFGVRASGFNIDLHGDLTDLHLSWFDRWLKDGEQFEEPPVKLFVMGVNRWRDEDAWPPGRATTEAWHLLSGGRLSRSPPIVADPPSTYVYDPGDPCPTLGGNLLMPLNYQRGPVDQNPLLSRRDVLVFTSGVLPESLEVTGPVTAVLFAATSGPDTDWVVKLCDVTVDERTFNVCDGILRATFREKDWTRPERVQPGEVVRYEVDLWATSMVFLAGHRIRVLVTSSDFPRYDRNPNTGELGIRARKVLPATQRIFCDPEHPSHVRLPVIG